MAILWLKFFICASLIVTFGTKLSKAAQRIVDAGALSEGLMGIFVLAAITSFPEVWTSIATVITVNAPDLGVGDLIGSVVFNLMILAALDIKYGSTPILSSVKKYHVLTCAFCLLLLGLVAASLSLKAYARNIGLFNVGLEGYLISIIYIACLFMNYKNMKAEEVPVYKESGGIFKICISLTIYAAIIIGAGFWLASIGKEIVDVKGWNEMYFGTIIIALTTSLPEIAVSLAAVSIGSPDMAVANILGSNLFNIFIIPVIDILFRKGYILSYVSLSHIYSTVIAIALTLVVLCSIMFRPKWSYKRLGIGTLTIIFVFFIGNIFLYCLIR